MTTGILHVYHASRNLNLFEHLPYHRTTTGPNSASISISTSTSTSTSTIHPPKHILLFIGGLYDTFNLPHYVTDLSRLFPIPISSSPNQQQEQQEQPWRIMHVQLSSNGRSWGIFSIDRDIEEIAAAVDFIRTTLYPSTSPDIVLMGHSTGCQDIMRYLSAPNPLTPRSRPRPAVQGAILQAPVSDRDAVVHAINDADAPEIRKAYDAVMAIVAATADKDRRDTVLPMQLTRPLFGPAPVCVERFLSLVSPGSPDRPSVEDFFSHDLGDDAFGRTFGSIGAVGLLRTSAGGGNVDAGARAGAGAGADAGKEQSSLPPPPPPTLLVLMSDSDEHVGSHIDKRGLLARWERTLSVQSGCMLDADSDVVLNAIHDVSGTDWPSQEARLVNLRRAVLNYLGRRVGGVTEEAWRIWKQDRESVMTLKRNDGRDIDKQVGVLKL